ncbi:MULTISPECIES: SsgA family sporulation/cell division regulator [Streptomyces]|uniref:SsgA family sporulation/cell division regulator n=1 Tax=Streptomyces edwardsiae TaxID=3075527 RepID=A0ABU2QH39_9ACTN|nr:MULTISPECIES: SsgA family sporulation/cell division regulator [unclassified Streptomyces]MDT0403174.1 SsgA family sporulation/cell division regulator [Streptomyces sp. DSM 41635]
MSVVEQYARAHIVTDETEEDRGAVPVVLRYDPDEDPLCVRVALPGAAPREWIVDRELLERGLLSPTGRGEIRVWPCGRVQAVIEFHTAQGVSVVQFETKTLARFLRRARAAAEPVPH